MPAEPPPDCGQRAHHPPSAARSPNHDAPYHKTVLCVSAAILAAALLLRVRPDQRVELRFLPGWPAPELCQSRALFGWECPGCGLTRSFVYLAHGDLAASLGVHRVGWLCALCVLLQLPYRIWALRTLTPLPLGTRLPWIIAVSLVGLLIADWLARIAAAAH